MLPEGNFFSEIFFFAVLPFPSAQKSRIWQIQMRRLSGGTLFMAHIFIVWSTVRHITPPITHRRIYSEASLKKKMPQRHKSLSHFYFVVGMEVIFTCKSSAKNIAIQNQRSVLTSYFLHWQGVPYKKNCNNVYFPGSQNCNALTDIQLSVAFLKINWERERKKKKKDLNWPTKQEKHSRLYIK